MPDYCPTIDAGLSPGQLGRILVNLNPEMFVWTSRFNNYRSAGLYLRKDGGFGRPFHVMGLPIDWIPVLSEVKGKGGEIVRRGYRDIILTLWAKGLVKDSKYYRRLTRGWRTHPM